MRNSPSTSKTHLMLVSVLNLERREASKPKWGFKGPLGKGSIAIDDRCGSHHYKQLPKPKRNFNLILLGITAITQGSAEQPKAGLPIFHLAHRSSLLTADAIKHHIIWADFGPNKSLSICPTAWICLFAVYSSVPDVQEVSLRHESWCWAHWAAHDGQSGLTPLTVGQGTSCCSLLCLAPAKKTHYKDSFSSCPSSLSPVCTSANSSFCDLQRRSWMLLFTCSTTWTWSLTEVPEHQTWSVHTNNKRQPLPSITYSPNKQDRQKVREETQGQKKWRDSPAVTQ